MCFTVVFVVGISQSAHAQDRTISGKVTSESDGTTLPGVSVVVKGTTIGTQTDGDGNYTLSVPSTGTLIFSFIGFKTKEVAIGSASVVDASLGEDAKTLEEVVVTGYGVQEKRSITGSVASVKGSTFRDLPVQSMDRALQGRAAGVQVSAASGQPGGALTVRIRGTGSINGNNDPLWIIDGVQMGRLGGSGQGSSNPLGAINPNDIESIDILKDAAASAIYGAQAANGVVIVTTKKGKGKTTIDISTQYGVVKPLNLYDMTNARQFATLKEEAYVNAGLGAAAAHATFGDPNDPDLPSYDWVKALFRDAKLSTTDLSISAGDDKTTFLFSGSYQMQEGQVIMSDWKRGTGRLNITHKANERLNMAANISMAYQETFGSIADGNFVNGPFMAAFSSQPTSPARAEDGRYNRYPLVGSHLSGYNILQGVNEEVRTGKTYQTISSLSAGFKIIEGLTLNALVGIDFSNNRDDNQRPGSIPAFAGGQVTITNRRTINWNDNVTLNFSRKFADVHSVSAMVGYEYKQQIRQGVTAQQFGYPDPYFVLLSSGATARPATEFFSEFRRQGIFGQVKYAYNDKYMADFTLRRDGSSRFGKNSRYGTFYAGSVAWRIKEEAFLSGVTFLDELKLRAGYGVVGNSEIGDYDALTLFGPRTLAQYLGQPVMAPTQIGNDLLTWENNTQFNVGVDFGFIGGRIYGSVEYFDRLTEDLLFSVPLPSDSGFGSIVGNAGSVSNKGIEVELGATVLDMAGFKWETNFNFATLKNELKSLPGGQERVGNTLIVGEPLRFFYLLEFAGVNPANGKTMIYDTLGNLSYAAQNRDAAVRGSAIPTYYGGWSNTFSYKGISLDVFFQFQGGNKAFNQDMYNYYTSGSVANNQFASQMDRWQQPGDITNVHRPFEGNAIDGHDQYFGAFGTTQFLSDASYIRLKQVTLAYSLPSDLIKRIGMSRVKVFVQGLNLATWTKYDGIDPEVVSNNNNTGVSTYGAYPVGRQYSAGINLTF